MVVHRFEIDSYLGTPAVEVPVKFWSTTLVLAHSLVRSGG